MQIDTNLIFFFLIPIHFRTANITGKNIPKIRKYNMKENKDENKA